MLDEHKNDLELAIKVADRIIGIQECSGGYDYCIMGANYQEIDGGVYDNPDISIVDALKDILEDLADNPDYNGAKGGITKDSEIKILNFDDVMDKFDLVNSLGVTVYDSEVIMNFKAKTEECFQHIEGMGPADIEDLVLDYVQNKLYGMDVEVRDAVISGSRCRGLEGSASDLDVVVEIKGNEREDYLFNILHEEEFMLGNIPVDINPITKEESGTLEEYLPKVEKYLEEKALQIGGKSMATEKENAAQDIGGQDKKEFKEVTLKFGKGLVSEPFQGKDGKEYKQISIPNQDPADKSPWASFVVRANAVHEDQFGKGMWVKLPADGSTTVRKDNVVGQDEAGKNIYETTKEKVPNKELKERVEFYKGKENDRDSLKDRLSSKKDAVSQSKSDTPKQNVKSKENAL